MRLAVRESGSLVSTEAGMHESRAVNGRRSGGIVQARFEGGLCG